MVRVGMRSATTIIAPTSGARPPAVKVRAVLRMTFTGAPNHGGLPKCLEPGDACSDEIK